MAPAYRCLLCSVLLRPPFPMEQWPLLTQMAALAIRRGLTRACDEAVAVGIKWPNDLFIGERKVAGILLETSRHKSADGSHAVLGFGVNVNLSREELPPDLEAIATSLSAELGNQVERETVAIPIFQALDSLLADFPENQLQIIAEVSRASILLGKRVRALSQGKEIRGRALELSASGALVLEQDDGTLLSLTSADSVRLERL